MFEQMEKEDKVYGNLLNGEYAGSNNGHQTVDYSQADSDQQDTQRDCALGVLGDRHHGDGGHGSTLAGKGHDGQGYDETGETAGEHTVHIKESGLYLGDTHDNEQRNGDDQDDGHHIVDLGYKAGALDGSGKEEGDDSHADQLGIFTDDREYHRSVVCDGAAVHSEANAAHDGEDSAHTGEGWVEEHGLHVIVAALKDEHGAHNHMEEVCHEHEQTSKGDRDEDRTSGSSDTGTHHNEDARTDGTSEAQTEDVKQAKLFTFHTENLLQKIQTAQKLYITDRWKNEYLVLCIVEIS